MRTPIACALAWPERIEAGVEPLDFTSLAKLEFERVDLHRFPCVRLAQEAIRSGGTAPAALNAANEVAVDAFLGGRVGYTDIARIIENVLGEVDVEGLDTLERVYAADVEARALASRYVARLPQVSRSSP
jgi:1-deoxy-D-xylulose-5-phosphate reductoisomerase